MPYIRISLMKPQEGHADEVERLNRELVGLYQGSRGCLVSYLVTAADGSGETGRVSVWESEDDADRAANEHRSLALRSQLHLRVEEGHVERSFLTE
ncbi:MAG: antibiotic biosynthesis monooxygenase [Chloroflexi bacterium]|nr:antibiotic biosynthesis monooxygenase [Chloroflexota bacterium]